MIREYKKEGSPDSFLGQSFEINQKRRKKRWRNNNKFLKISTKLLLIFINIICRILTNEGKFIFNLKKSSPV